MEAAILFVVVAGGFAVLYTLTEMFDEFLVGVIGLVIYLAFAASAFAGLYESAEKAGAVKLATATCVADVTADTDWVGMSVPALRTAAEANVPAEQMADEDAAAAIEACYQALQAEASTAG